MTYNIKKTLGGEKMSIIEKLFKQNKNVARKDTSILDFIIGMILVAGGLYSILKNTSIGVIWINRLWGTSLPSGIVTIPILIGITILFLKHRSKFGWWILVVGVILLLLQIVLSLKITFITTSLLDYFLMFGGTFGGLGLLARAYLR